jgi:hypothetical protein
VHELHNRKPACRFRSRSEIFHLWQLRHIGQGQLRQVLFRALKHQATMTMV